MRANAGVLLFLLATAGFAVLVPAQEPTETGLPAHLRWILDLKKKHGYEDFQRVKSDKPWKHQQGIVFLTPNEVVVYQVKPGSAISSSGAKPAAFYLQVDILDARDGREIKDLLIPGNSEPGKVMVLRDGAFLVQSGDMLFGYSANFEQVASRQLASAKNIQSQEWQIDVSPSRTRVMLAHQQAWQEGQGKKKETSSKADIEVLDPATLKTVKAFSIPYLDAWSAEDNDIISTDPDGEDGNRDFGILDFDGKWRELRTTAENNDPECPYEMKALSHQRIAAHDCDELVVISASGEQQLSQPVHDGNFLMSVAGADRYLAEAFLEPESSHVFVSVYDFRRRATVSWVSLEKNDIYYALSSAGTLAVVDGDKLKLFDPLKASDLQAQNPQRAWSVELVDQYSYEGFDRDNANIWSRQQDVRFITPDEIAVYQAIKNDESTPLVEIDPSGGQGLFHLQLEIFSARDGHEIKAIHLPTNSQFTRVNATHDGKFIVRTGDILYLYSADFQQLASRELPLNKIGGTEGWQVDVPASGSWIVLAHQQRFGKEAPFLTVWSNQSHAEVEILDADTLQPMKRFVVKSLPDTWSAGDQFLVFGNPKPEHHAIDVLDFNGKRQELRASWDVFNKQYPSLAQALPQGQIAELGCKAFVVISGTGATTFSVDLLPVETSVMASSAGPFVAAEIARLQIARPISDAKPSRIEAYDLKTKTTTTSVQLQSHNPYFDISTRGELAVVENDHLSLYTPKTH